MPTSSEDIETLIERFTTLANIYDGKVSEINTLLNARADTWDTFETQLHVDQAAGNNAGTGAEDSPLADIQEAINRVPFGSRGAIKIRGTYGTTRRYSGRGRHISLLGADANWSVQNAPIQMEINYEVDNLNRFHTLGFTGEFSGSWDFFNINLVAKTLTEVTSAHPTATFNDSLSAIFSRVFSLGQMGGSVFLRYCDVDITGDPYVTLFNFATWRFEFFTVTQANPLTGRYVANASSGTPTADLGHILSNIGTL